MTRIAVVMENELDLHADPRLATSDGLSYWIDSERGAFLFDTGLNLPDLRKNLRILQLDPRSIDAIVISHSHADHIGGLEGLVGWAGPKRLVVPVGFPRFVRERLEGAGCEVVQVDGPPLPLAEGVWAFSLPVPSLAIYEVSVALDTPRGLFLVLGCGHPGLLEILKFAVARFQRPLRGFIGGTHLMSLDEGVKRMILALDDIGLQEAYPGHCTRPAPKAFIEDTYPGRKLGVGALLTL